MNEVETFRPLRTGEIKDLSAFSTMLEGLVVRLKGLKKESELGNGILFQKLVGLLPKDQIVTWRRWLRIGGHEESIASLLKFVEEEEEDLRRAAECTRPQPSPKISFQKLPDKVFQSNYFFWFHKFVDHFTMTDKDSFFSASESTNFTDKRFIFLNSHNLFVIFSDFLVQMI